MNLPQVYDYSLKRVRNIQSNDFAIVTDASKNYTKFIIHSVDNKIIILKTDNPNFLGALVLIDGIWKVYGTNDKYDVKFEAGVTLTGVSDVNLDILLLLDDKSLMAVCNTNKEMYNICKNDTFWEEKVKMKFKEAVPFKPINFTWRFYYDELIALSNYMAEQLDNDYDRIIEWMEEDLIGNTLEKLYALQWLDALGYKVSKNTAYEALFFGQIDVLDWLYSKGIFPVESDAALYAIINGGSTKSLQWLADHGAYLNIDRILHFMQQGLKEPQIIEIFKWMIDLGYYDEEFNSYSILHQMLYDGQFKVADYLLSQGFMLYDTAIDNLLDERMENENISGIREWLKKNNFINEEE